MLHVWIVCAALFCAALASLALVRGVAGMLAGRGALARLEALVLTIAGLAGWLALVLLRRAAG